MKVIGTVTAAGAITTIIGIAIATAILIGPATGIATKIATATVASTR